MAIPIHFRWLGVAGIELRVGEQVLLIDPYLTRIRFWQMWLGRVAPNRRLIAENLLHGDFVLVSHAHFDHCLDVPEVVRNTGALALGSPNTCRLLALCGVPAERIRVIGAGDRLALGEFAVEVIAIEHGQAPGFAPGPLAADLRPPLRARDYRMDGCFAFLVQAGACRLLVGAGEQPAQAAPADVLFTGIAFGPPGHICAYYEALLQIVRPRAIIPLHWDDLFRPLAQGVRPMQVPTGRAVPPLRRVGLAEFRRTIEQVAPGTQVLIPEVFRLYDLSE